MEARAVFGGAGEHGFGVFCHVEIAVADVLHCFADVGGVVLREIPRIGPRVGDHFVLFVKRLGDLEGALGGEGGFALEGGEVVKLGGNLRLRFFLLGNLAGLALAARLDGLGGELVPKALGLGQRGVFVLFPGFIDPFTEVFTSFDAEGRVDLEIRGGLEGLDLSLALGEDGQRRRLDAACGGDVEAAVARIEAGEGAGGVETDEPIRLGAAFRGIGEGFHGLAGAEIFPSFEDGVVGHRLHPEPSDGLGDFADFDDVAEDELTFAAGVAGVDDVGDVFALGELEDLFETGLRVWDGVEVELVGDGGEHAEVPGEFFPVWTHGHAKLDEVAHGGGDDGGVVFKKHVAA